MTLSAISVPIPKRKRGYRPLYFDLTHKGDIKVVPERF